MILHIVRILPPQKLCNNSPRRTFSSPPESNFGHRGPSELTRARRRYSSSGPRRYRVHPDTPPPHRYRIGSVLSQLPPVSYRIRSIGIEYSPDPIRNLDPESRTVQVSSLDLLCLSKVPDEERWEPIQWINKSLYQTYVWYRILFPLTPKHGLGYAYIRKSRASQRKPQRKPFSR